MSALNTLEILITAKNEASKVLENISGDAGALGDKLVKVGTQFTVATAAIGVGLVMATSSALAFDKQMTNTAAVLGQTRAEQQALSAEILRFSQEAPQGPHAVAEAYYDIVGGVADATTHMAILEAATNTATAGAASLQGTTSALIAVMNSYNFSANDAAMVSDVLTKTVGVGVGTMEEFAAALPQVAGLAASVGISFQDLGAQTAFLTTKGHTASAAVTELRAMITALLTPNEQMKDLIRAAGFESGESAMKTLGLVGAYQALQGTADSTGISLATAIGSVEALTGAVALATDAGAQAISDFGVELEGATAAAKAIQMESPASQLALLKSSFEGLRIEVGNAVLPVLGAVTEVVTPIINGFATLIQENPGLIQAVVGAAGAFSALGPAIAGVGAAMKAVNTVTTLASGPFGLLIIIASLVGAAFASNFGGIRDFFVEELFPIFMEFGALFKVLFDALKPLLAGIAELFASTLGAVFDLMRPFIDILMEAIRLITGLIKLITGDFSGGMASIGGALQSAGMPTSPAMNAQQQAYQRAQQGWEQQRQAAASTSSAIELGQIPDTSDFFNDYLAGNGPILSGNQDADYMRLLYEYGGSRDAGGRGLKGMAYSIGTGAQPEVFVPDSNGTFVPGGAGGDTYQINVNVPETSLVSREAAIERGHDFGRAIEEELRRN